MALTKEGAVFRNGRQLVIPHRGAQFMQELMEALTSDEFVAGIVGSMKMECGSYGVDVMATCNDVEGHAGMHSYTDEQGDVSAWRDAPLEVVHIDNNPEGLAEACPAEHYTGVRCDRLSGHPGSHTGWLGGPEDWGGGDQVTWDAEEEPENPVTTGIPAETTWEGFTIQHHGNGTSATVWHPKSTKRIGFTDRQMAETMLTDPFLDFYDRLCATGYIEWFDIYFPGQEDWHNWKPGDIVISDQGKRGFIIPAGGQNGLVNDEGTLFIIVRENADVLSHWTVSGR
jgi:hypothetical protein